MTDHATFRIGGELEVHRLGRGTMRLTGRGIWGPPADPAECRDDVTIATKAGLSRVSIEEIEAGTR